ncbi:MAG: hypothetical protein E7286_05755 [Lachnospiraceae bacterium]|nr:hypothetical protein [Lachnospiraceae bacterium]
MRKMCLLVNGLCNPCGVSEKPVFSWIPGTEEIDGKNIYGRGQAAYRVIVSSDMALAQQGIGDLWDSGKVESEDPYDVVYAGAALTSKTDYFWRVQVWEKDVAGACCDRAQEECADGDECEQTQWDVADRLAPESEAAWSEIASFTTGINRQEEWQGQWIGAGDAVEKFTRKAPILRKTFNAKSEIKNAKLFICGLGLFEAQINGKQPDDSVLNCGNTQFTQTVPYRAFDVTGLVQQGENAIAVELGNGFYNEHTGVWFWEKAKWRDNPKLLLNLDIHYTDGTNETIVTDTGWKVWVNGPTVENSIYLGDTYDENLRVDGYGLADFDDSAWLPAQPAQAPAGKLVCQTLPPVRRVAEFKALSIEKLETETFDSEEAGRGSSWLITAPEMLSGWAKIRMKAAKGKKITITYGEQLDGNGRVRRIGNGQGECGDWWPVGIIQQDFYISDGSERFWEPKYSYKGYRYIQVDGYEGEMTSEDVILYCLANDMDVISEFECSDPDLVKLHMMMRRTLRNNFLWKPTDTPVWEKNGWLGDANVSLGAMFYEYDMRHMMKHFIDIMNDCFTEYGLIPCMVPTADWSADANQVVWNTIFVFATEYLYHYYGQKETVKELYPRLKAYAQKCIEDSRSYEWTWADKQLSDWLSPQGDPDAWANHGEGPEGSGICGSVFVYKMLQTMERLATLAGCEQDIVIYRDAEEKMYAAFQTKYFHPEENLYDTGFWLNYEGMIRTKYRQTSNLLPLEADIVPEQYRADVLKRLVQDIHEKGDHLDTGCVGTRIFLPVLADNGYADLAWKVLKQDTYPSWGFLLAKGSDTMWENWESATRSLDHYFFGTCDEFFYSHLSGIRQIKDGCKHVTIKPLFYKELAYAGASVQTVRGELSCRWKWEKECAAGGAEGDRSAEKAGRVRLEIKVPYGAEAEIILPAGKIEILKGREGICGHVDVCGDAGACGDGKIKLAAASGEYVISLEV